MSMCSCCGVTFDCQDGCGCICASECGDCVKWCEPSDPVFATLGHAAAAIGGGALMRTIKQPDGSELMTMNARAAHPGQDAPRHAPTTRLTGCLRGATTESLARILDLMHSCSVRASRERATDTIDESVDGTLEELAEKYGLVVE